MKGTVIARVRRVLRGHSDRTFVHAVTEGGTADVPAGLEYKLELPTDAVRDVTPGQELVLTLTWALEPAVTIVAPPAPTALPSAVDEAFMSLMARRRGASSAPVGQTTAPAIGPPSSAAEELARRLGIRSVS